MHERKSHINERIYPTYEPYPVSRDPEQQHYSPGHDSEEPEGDSRQEGSAEEFSLITDPTPSWDWPSSGALLPDGERPFRPLRLLNSLFSDRLNFLQRALEELEGDRSERQRLTRDALEALDSDIRECEHALSCPALVHPERKRDLERRLLELKREHRREKLMSWRDLVWLKGEIRKLQREIEALGRTTGSTENCEHPT